MDRRFASLLVHTCVFLTQIAHLNVTSADHQNDKVSIEGIVLDANGDPLSDVETNAVFLSRRSTYHPFAGSTVVTVVGRATTNARGSFHMQVRRAIPSQDITLELFAYKKGHGVVYRYLQSERDRHDVRVALPREKVVVGQFLGPNGDPLVNASVRQCTLRMTLGRTEATFPFHDTPKDFSAWPPAFQTGRDGRFRIVGASSNTEVVLDLNDERVARERWTVTIGEDPTKMLTLNATESRTVEGVVVAAKKRNPIAAADVVLTTWEDHQFVGKVHAITDEMGRFSVRPWKGNGLNIRVTAPKTEYKTLERRIPWVDGTTAQRMTLPLYDDKSKPIDGTTPDGLPASTMDADYPPVKLIHSRPSRPLTAKLTGTLVVSASITTKKALRIRGVLAINPATGAWRTVIEDAVSPRVSPDGKLLAFCTPRSRSLQIVAFESPFRPHHITNKCIGPPCWIPTADMVLANISTPAKREYFGEQFWGHEREKWWFDASGKRLTKIAVPPLYHAFDVSPSGQLVAMHWDTHADLTGAQLYVSRINGAELRPLARKKSQYYWYPRFSPDGKTVLAKHLDRRHGPTVHIVALDGTEERSISVSDGYGAEEACWSPDGNHIAVVAYKNDALTGGRKNSKIFIVDVAGTRVTEVALVNVERVAIANVDWTSARLL